MSKYYFVGAGIASLAGAAYLIRDADVAGNDIVILEESKQYGGTLDAHGDANTGYFMSGSRLFEHKYNCTFDLLSSIPSTSDPAISITEETKQAEAKARWYSKARLVDGNGRITDFHALGFSERDRIDLLLLMATPESLLDSKRITDCFAGHFSRRTFGSSGARSSLSSGGTARSSLNAIFFAFFTTSRRSTRKRASIAPATPNMIPLPSRSSSG